MHDKNKSLSKKKLLLWQHIDGWKKGNQVHILNEHNTIFFKWFHI